MDGSFTNSRARVKMRANKYEKNGQTYLKFERFNLKIQIGKNRLNLKNLFNGDPNLGAIGNQFINENSELFLGEILPGLEKNLAEIFTKTANEIVGRFICLFMPRRIYFKFLGLKFLFSKKKICSSAPRFLLNNKHN